MIESRVTPNSITVTTPVTLNCTAHLCNTTEYLNCDIDSGPLSCRYGKLLPSKAQCNNTAGPNPDSGWGCKYSDSTGKGSYSFGFTGCRADDSSAVPMIEVDCGDYGELYQMTAISMNVYTHDSFDKQVKLGKPGP
jgi:hypothetical protein